ncbi:MAG: arylamine N-acetyltransferase [Chloroflexota bacterium]|nr:arylamine N-acetyltransferase [Chloroflexota bacterium]
MTISIEARLVEAGRSGTSEWDTDRLDVAAYLDRINYGGALEPSSTVLTALHRAHATTIPFENLNIILGRGVSLDIEDIQGKLLRSKRGGYCFEHNLLFSALLERSGFAVRRLVARVQPDKPGPRTHMLLNVTADGQEWLADVGFGAALLEPVPLVDGVAVRQGGWTHGVTHETDDSWRLRTLGAGGWSDLYGFSSDPQRPNDYVVYNHYTSTYPGSPFVNQIVAMRVTPTERFTLRTTGLSTTLPDGSTHQRELTDAGILQALHETFGITLDSADEASLITFLRRAAPRP